MASCCCRECGATVFAARSTREFCDAACRRAFHNRKAIRGAVAYDFLMAWRVNREAFEAAGGRTLLTRLVAAFRAEDERDRGGRQSWDDLAKAKQRHPEFFATVVGVNVAGVRK
jgi:hypothetical protein